MRNKASALFRIDITKISELVSSPVLISKASILSEAAKTIGSVQVRNRATIGGNLCRAAPSADLVPALIVLDAQVCIAGSGGNRIMQVEDFFLAPGRTVLNTLLFSKLKKFRFEDHTYLFSSLLAVE